MPITKGTTTKKKRSRLSRAEIEEQRRMLLALKPTDKYVKRMIELSLQGLEEGVEPMTPDEIHEYLGRG